MLKPTATLVHDSTKEPNLLCPMPIESPQLSSEGVRAAGVAPSVGIASTRFLRSFRGTSMVENLAPQSLHCRRRRSSPSPVRRVASTITSLLPQSLHFTLSSSVQELGARTAAQPDARETTRIACAPSPEAAPFLQDSGQRLHRACVFAVLAAPLAPVVVEVGGRHEAGGIRGIVFYRSRTTVTARARGGVKIVRRAS